MNLKQIFPLVIFILISLFGCAPKEQKISELFPMDSLGWQNDENYMFKASNFYVDEEEIIIVNSTDPIILIYETDTKKFINSFGRKGKGPGEFSQPLSIIRYKNKYWISDSNNFRIQSISYDTKDIQIYNTDFSMRLYTNDEKLFSISLFKCGMNPVSVLKENEFVPYLIEQKLYNNNQLEEKDIDDHNRISFIQNKMVLVFCENHKILVFDQDLKLIETQFEYSKMFDGEDSRYCSARAYKKGFLIPITTGDDEVNPFYLVYYNFSGKIEQIFKVEKNEQVFSPSLGMIDWALVENRAFFYDFNSGIIYEYELGK